MSLAGAYFKLVHENQLVYNQCWEDPLLDREALRLGPRDRLVAITSAGCNVLDYALLGSRVLAVDMNPRQNHLLELKLAGIRALGFDDFFDLFGRGASPRAHALYATLRPHLSLDARGFWDRHLRLFVPGLSRGGSFYYGGTSGLFAFAVQRYIDHVARARDIVERILASPTLDEQVDLYTHELRPRLLGKALLRLVGSTGVLSLLGVPAPQRSLVDAHQGGFAGFLKGCLDRVLSVCLLRDNYFWRVYLDGRYSRESCPEYLKPWNFARLKAGLVDNIQVRTATVTEALRKTGETFTAFILLDHMDWLCERPELLEEEWRSIFAAAAAGARVIFRSGAKDASFLPRGVRERLRFDEPRAVALHRRDRVGTYGSFHIAQLACA
jgi:S-adenosylmethionine-diacylglycerol 3-amino-3-carboxypropyl transferase